MGVEHWHLTTLGELIGLQRGHDLTDGERRPGKIPVMGSAGMNGYHDQAKAKGPGVVLGRSGASFGQVHYCPTEFWPHNTTIYVTDFRGNDPRFTYYLLKSMDFNRYNSGSAQPSLNRNHIYRIAVSVPTLDEQRRIAQVLGALDDKIELNCRMSHTLEAMGQAIFKEWFVDFGPVRAKMQGRGAYLGPVEWSLFPSEFSDRGMPTGWHRGTLADYANLNPESWSESTYPLRIEYVDLAGAKWGTIGAVAYEREQAPSRAQRILRSGDTIIGMVRPGNGSYAFVGKDGLTGSTGFAVLRPQHRCKREFVYFASTSSENIARLAHAADGAAYPAVRPDVVLATKVPIIGEVPLIAFSETTGPLLDRSELNKQECNTLATTRDLLLPKLMSGEIRTTDAEKAAEAVL